MNRNPSSQSRVTERDRTANPRSHSSVLCLLSYGHHVYRTLRSRNMSRTQCWIAGYGVLRPASQRSTVASLAPTASAISRASRSASIIACFNCEEKIFSIFEGGEDCNRATAISPVINTQSAWIYVRLTTSLFSHPMPPEGLEPPRYYYFALAPKASVSANFTMTAHANRRESNPHDRSRDVLSVLCLPVPPLWLGSGRRDQ